MVLADVVGRMRLAGEDDLHRPAGGVQDPREPIGVVEDQLGPLVAGEAAREADRQRVGIEQRAGGDDARDADVLFGPALARALADEGEQVAPQRLRARPQLLVGDREHAVPERRVVVAIDASRRRGARRTDRASSADDPRRHVHAVGDGAHRPLGFGDARPHRRPHRARHLAVQLADGVDRSPPSASPAPSC